MKRLLSIALVITFGLSLGACSTNSSNQPRPMTPVPSETVDAGAELSKLRPSFVRLVEKRDDVEGFSVFRHPSSPEYVNVESTAFAFISWSDGSAPKLALRFNYVGTDWIFFDEIIVSVDGENSTIYPSYSDVNRNNKSGKVWEWYTERVFGTELVDSIARSSDTIVRLKGDDGKKIDITLTAEQRKSFEVVSKAFQYADLYWDENNSLP